MVGKLAIDVLLGTNFIDKHILAILTEEWKAIVRDSNPVAIIEQGNMPANAVLTTKDTEKVKMRFCTRQATTLKKVKNSPLSYRSRSN